MFPIVVFVKLYSRIAGHTSWNETGCFINRVAADEFGRELSILVR